MAVISVSNILPGGTVLVDGIPSDDLVFRWVTFLLPLILVPFGVALFKAADDNQKKDLNRRYIIRLHMHKLLLIVTLFCSISAFAQNEDLKKTITPEVVLKAVNLFKSDPMGKDADGALSVITNFAENSDQVTIEISEKYFPWKFGSLGKEFDAKFLGAFIAGNLECQLEKKIKKSCPIEGIHLVLETYQALRNAKKIKAHQKIEKWIELDKKGELANEVGI